MTREILHALCYALRDMGHPAAAFGATPAQREGAWHRFVWLWPCANESPYNSDPAIGPSHAPPSRPRGTA